MKEVIQAALSVVVPGQEEYMWNCLRDERVIADVSEEPPAKRKRIDTGLVQTLISAHKTRSVHDCFPFFLLTIDEGKTVDNEEITKRNSVAQSAR